jgi:hypothetical protein
MTPANTLTHHGTEQSITEWALDYGITPGIIIARLERGMTIGDAITTPMKVGHRGQRLPIFSRKQMCSRRAVQSYARKHSIAGRSLTLREWAGVLGITYNALCQRMHKLGTLEAVVIDHVQRSGPGVSSDFAPSEGTGGGSTLQESTNITFSGKAENA